MENIKRIKICGYIFDRIKSICNKGSDKIPNDKDTKLKIMISKREKQSCKPMRHSRRNSYIMIFFSLPSFQPALLEEI